MVSAIFRDPSNCFMCLTSMFLSRYYIDKSSVLIGSQHRGRNVLILYKKHLTCCTGSGNFLLASTYVYVVFPTTEECCQQSSIPGPVKEKLFLIGYNLLSYDP